MHSKVCSPKGGGLDSPEGIVFGPDGDLFVVSLFTNNVLRYDGTSGAFEGIFAQGGGLTVPRDLIFVSDLIVSSSGDGRVLRYDGVTGAFEDVFAALPQSSPFGLAVGPDLGPLPEPSLPEPGTLSLLALGLLGFAFVGWRQTGDSPNLKISQDGIRR